MMTKTGWFWSGITVSVLGALTGCARGTDSSFQLANTSRAFLTGVGTGDGPGGFPTDPGASSSGTPGASSSGNPGSSGTIGEDPGSCSADSEEADCDGDPQPDDPGTVPGACPAGKTRVVAAFRCHTSAKDPLEPMHCLFKVAKSEPRLGDKRTFSAWFSSSDLSDAIKDGCTRVEPNSFLAKASNLSRLPGGQYHFRGVAVACVTPPTPTCKADKDDEDDKDDKDDKNKGKAKLKSHSLFESWINEGGAGTRVGAMSIASTSSAQIGEECHVGPPPSAHKGEGGDDDCRPGRLAKKYVASEFLKVLGRAQGTRDLSSRRGHDAMSLDSVSGIAPEASYCLGHRK